MINYDYLNCEEIQNSVSDPATLAGVKEYSINDGTLQKMRVIEVYTAQGLRFNVLPDRGMDIAEASFRGVPIAFLSKAEQACSPPTDAMMQQSFFRYFFGGLLTTCGLDNVGEACEEDGIYYPMHGSRTFLCAKNVCVSVDDDFHAGKIYITGKMKMGTLFGENVILKRTIVTGINQSCIELTDEIINIGTKEYEYMTMYHINFGYPMIEEGIAITTSFKNAELLEGDDKELRFLNTMDKPRINVSENVYCRKNSNSPKAEVRIKNKKLGIGAVLSYDSQELACFAQWNSGVLQDYALGLEPGTHLPIGRAAARKSGLMCIQPNEKKTIKIKIMIEELA